VKAGRIVSDAPVVSEVAVGEERGPVLRRRLDPSFRSHPRARSAFLAEVEVAARQGLAGGGLASVFLADAGPDPVLEREFRPEGTLRTLIDSSGPVSAEQVLAVVSGLTEALDTLHRLGVVHGDPCPENVLLRAEGGILLADACSSRRTFCGRPAGVNLEETMALDRIRILSIARRLLDLGGGGEPSPLRSELVAITECGWEAERMISAFLKHAPREPVPIAGGRPVPVASIPFPVPVVLSVSPVRDPRVRHAVARIGSVVSGLTPARVSESLERGILSLPSTFPVPSRSIADALRTAGATVFTSLPGRNPAAARFKED
jgi:serine/threonine protein kinase